MKLFGFIRNFLSPQNKDPEINQLRSYIRFFLFLAILFIFVFSVTLIFTLRESKIYQLIDFRGKDIIFTTKELQKKNLKMNLSEKIDLNIPKYKVIFQSPAPGEIVKEGRSISIVISSGNQFVAMPNLISNHYEEAKEKIYSLFGGYKTVPKVVKIERYTTLPEGLVVDQSPKFQENLAPDQKVLLMVSRGKVDQAIIVSNYRARNFKTVEKTLLEKGLKVKVRYLITDQRKKSGKIFSQSIKEGEQIIPGEEIEFEVGIFSDLLKKDVSSKEIIRFYTLRVPFIVSEFEENSLKNSTNFNEKLHTPEPLNTLSNSTSPTLRTVKLTIEDILGEQTIVEEAPSGSMVDLPYKTFGNGILKVYLDDDLFDTINF